MENLKAMDIAGFNLSLAGVEVLRCVEVNEQYGRGVLPSKASILRAARDLERAAVGHCSFTMISRTFENDPDQMEEKEDELVDYDMGKGFEFNAFEVIRTLFKAFGLTEEASKRAIDLGLSSDGAQLTNTISHVAAGLKFNDVAMRDPFSKCLLLLHDKKSLVQSRNLCFLLRIVIAKDNKTTLNGFRPLNEQFKAGEVSDCLGCHAFKMSFPGDMKLQWDALDDGGAAKVKDKFCYICQCRSSTLHVPQERANCQICLAKMEHRVIFDQCYHYPFVAVLDVRSKLEDELALLIPLLVQGQEDNDVHGIQGVARKMRVCRVGEVLVTGDTLDIDFEDDDDRCDDAHARRAQWSRNITHELASRSMETFGSLQGRQVRLRAQLVIEQRSRDVAAILTDCQPKEKAMYIALQAVVCILHLENRVGLKSIETVLRSGLSNARRGLLEWTIGTGANGRQHEYVVRISKIIQTQILGSDTAPSQWRFPLNEEGNMGTLSMDNNCTRSVMNRIELIVAPFFPDSEMKRRLLCCFPHYRAAIIILQNKTDVTPEELDAFQDHIDEWFADWVHVFGREGCTNYTHMLSSSHVLRYMQEWKCLHRFSQQGWEALNALIKSYFFRRQTEAVFQSMQPKNRNSWGLQGGFSAGSCGIVAFGILCSNRMHMTCWILLRMTTRLSCWMMIAVVMIHLLVP